MTHVRAKLILIGALLVGLVCILAISRWVKLRTADQSKQVVVAANNLTAGERLTLKDLKVIEIPSARVQKGAFQNVRALDGRVLARDVSAQTVFSDDMLTPIGMVSGLAAIIAPGTRAMTVRVNDVVGVAGFALPGNYVDIIVNTEEKNDKMNTRKSISKIVLEKILVLAVAQEANRDATAPKVVKAVTLQVTPEQSEKIDLARSIGSLSLVLRNQLDQQISQTAGATQTTLLGTTQPNVKPVSKPVARQNCTQVISGTRMVRDCWQTF